MCGENRGRMSQGSHQAPCVVVNFMAIGESAYYGNVRAEPIHFALNVVHRSHNEQLVARYAEEIHQVASFREVRSVERRFETLRCVTAKLRCERVTVIKLVGNSSVQAGNHSQGEGPKVKILAAPNYQELLVWHIIGTSNVGCCLVADDDRACLIR